MFNSRFFHELLLFIGEELTALICSDAFELSICVTLRPCFIGFECSKLFAFVFKEEHHPVSRMIIEVGCGVNVSVDTRT